ncbi:MAG: RDD family protein [Acidimicrobiales bacterium]
MTDAPEPTYPAPPPGPGPGAAPPPGYGPAGATPPPAYGSQQYGYGYGAAEPYTLTSNGKRFGAYLLEAVLVVVTLFIGWIIWSIILWSKGQTPAKSILKMRVIKLDTGRAADGGVMALRELVGKVLLGLIPFYGIVSGIVILTDDQHQGLWDKLAGTVVIDDPDERFAPTG